VAIVEWRADYIPDLSAAGASDRRCTKVLAQSENMERW
jgi:hypothetical protein